MCITHTYICRKYTKRMHRCIFYMIICMYVPVFFHRTKVLLVWSNKGSVFLQVPKWGKQRFGTPCMLCIFTCIVYFIYLLSKRLSVCCLIVVYKSLFLSRSAISYFRLVLRGWSKVCTSVTTGFLHSILLGISLFYSAILKFKR